jgi:hypothetical protein
MGCVISLVLSRPTVTAYWSYRNQRSEFRVRWPPSTGVGKTGKVPQLY